ncbi:MAG: UDP-N-acetylmuramate--L-alanine ligase [Actinomycetales bacterium]|nr:UDP-N-acetylmuramate--L-alanine ligase [Actinomycetales bacterium]
MSIHFIGIGGAGMSVIAELFLAQGREVSGSDAKDSDVMARLRGLGARVHVGHEASQVEGAELVVVSTAVRGTNVELVRSRELGLEVIHRSQALALAAGERDLVAVAGAHGKTTTSAMLAIALRAAGADPSYAIGGRVLALGTGAHLGAGSVLVAEADESDGSFLNYAPRIAVVTNIEPDHLDHYGTEAAVHEAFEAFARRVVPGGLVVACADDDGARRLAQNAAARGTRVQTYGVDSGDVRIRLKHLGAGSSSAEIGSALGTVELDLAVPGAHNVLNATAAWCAGVELGIDPAAMAAALGEFTGTARRFEERGEVAGVRVVDDYAHHPTEVRALMRTARRAVGQGRVIVLFQPHLFSRTEAFAADFADALEPADEVVLTAIYAAREDPRPGVTSELVTSRLPGARYVPDAEEAARTVADLARPGDLVLTVGAGDVTALGAVVLARLGERS